MALLSSTVFSNVSVMSYIFPSFNSTDFRKPRFIFRNRFQTEKESKDSRQASHNSSRRGHETEAVKNFFCTAVLQKTFRADGDFYVCLCKKSPTFHANQALKWQVAMKNKDGVILGPVPI